MKYPQFVLSCVSLPSLPLRERGLKSKERAEIYKDAAKSLPLRERGLKLEKAAGVGISCESLPLRERGLKFYKNIPQTEENRRSPCGSVD